MNDLKSILLVDDDKNDVALTLNALSAHKLANDTVVVGDGAEALDYLFRRGKYSQVPAGNPVVVLLDLKMPKVDGIEVLRTIKSAPELRTIPIVVMTSSREDQDLQTCYGLGVNAYVVKPVQFGDFLAQVKHLGVFWALINQPPPGSVAPRR
jgi:CheY-like chemotaxis protein